jgi:hypothetical protein
MKKVLNTSDKSYGTFLEKLKRIYSKIKKMTFPVETLIGEPQKDNNNKQE